MSDGQKNSASEWIEEIIKIVCYISLPLILLFTGTMLSSVIFSGNINTDVNAASDFFQVLVSFSFPMLISLAIIPIAIQVFLQHNNFERLGFVKKPKRWSFIVCVALSAIIVLVTIYLNKKLETEISAMTICIHFLAVAISEEVILRSVIMHEMKNIISNNFLLCIINAIIFAFVYHSSEDFLSNLLVRVPLGFVLSYARLKSNDIYLPIALHWVYNMAVTAIG